MAATAIVEEYPTDAFSQQNNILFNQKPAQNTNKFLIQGHRGANQHINTLSCYQSAIDQRLDGIELDIWLTKDRKVCVVHGDDEGNVVKNGVKQKIMDLNLDEIQSIYAENKKAQNKQKDEMNQSQNNGLNNSQETACDSPGKNMMDMSFEDMLKSQNQQQSKEIIYNRIPTLEEVLELVNNQVRLNIEIKDSYDKEFLVNYLLDCIKQYKSENNVEISSFKHEFFDVIRKQIEIRNDQSLKNISFGYLIEEVIPEKLFEFLNNEVLLNKKCGENDSINFPAEILQKEEQKQKLLLLKQFGNYDLKCWFSFQTPENSEVYDSLLNIGVSVFITNQTQLINNYKFSQQLLQQN